ncbi:MAG: hypothetical protein ABII80_00220 [bacterium]
MSDDVSVELNRMSPVERLAKKSDDLDVLIDTEKGIFVSLGIPEKDDVIHVPDKPYVFVADELRVRDEIHSEGVIFEKIPILMAHGLRNEKDTWTFIGGQSIPETVNAYNQYAEKEGLPRLEFVVACNKDEVAEETGVRVYEKDIPNDVAYAVGEELVVNTVLESGGKSRIYVTAQGNIANLDTVRVARDISIVE